jgi:hypothetical protein
VDKKAQIPIAENNLATPEIKSLFSSENGCRKGFEAPAK